MRVESLDACPDLLDLHAFDPGRYPFLLESSALGDPDHARWDILFACPGETLTADPAAATGGFLPELDRAWAAERLDTPPDAAAHLPFRGGWFVYCGYELAAEIEPVLHLHAPAGALPRAFATRVPVAILRDRHSGQHWLVAEAGHDADADRVRADLGRVRGTDRPPAAVIEGIMGEEEPRRYLDAVARAIRYVHDGDVFQANLSRAWRGRLAGGATAADAYRRLREANAAPFSGLVRWSDGTSIASSSPERLVRIRGRCIETRPIAGTRARGEGEEADRALSAELIANAKERAEHVMLIDLERNDIGRVCVPGSVEVDEMMVIESYATVHHIVSNVRGTMRDEVTPGAAIAAVFPGGTITGCPKVRCMQIIAELEDEARGPYTGSFGYLNRDGDMDLNILIRTMLVDDGMVILRAGAGIVADSDPERELEETREKASGLLRALGVRA